MKGKAHNQEIRAAVLADLMAGMSVTDVAKKQSICRSTVSRYKARLLTDEQVEGISARINSNLIGSIKVHLGKGINLTKRDRLPLIERETYSELDLQQHFVSLIQTGELLQLKSARIIEQQVRLSCGVRLDVLLLHEDQSLTICEVKSCQGEKAKARGWLLYSAIGQLLYYANAVAFEYETPIESINLVLAIDYEPDLHFKQSLRMVNKSITVVNLREEIWLEENATTIQ